MKKRSLLLLPGIALILLSLCFGLFFGIRCRLGAERCRRVAEKLTALLPERTAGAPEGDAMPVLQLEGKDFAALLEIPAVGAVLPVADQWEQKDLYSGPARFCGSVYSGLVIGGADLPGQFGFCDEIGHGARVVLTDMTGGEYHYEVTRIHRAKHAEAAWLMAEEYDLTLFCRSTLSMEYIAVRCRRI